VSEQILQLTDDSFENDVIKSSSPVLVDYWAEWCGPCKMIAPILGEIATEYADRIKVCKLDIDSNQATPPKYGIRGILIAWCVVFPALYAFLMRFCLRNLELEVMPFIRSFVPATVASAVMALAVTLSQPLMISLPEVGRLVISIALGATAYAATVFIVFPKDVRSFRDGISRLMSRDS